MSSPASLVRTLRHVVPSEDARNTVAVASGKGGVGKTWFAISLCHALARRGRNMLLFDGDLGLANVDVQLGLAPKHDLAAVLAGERSLAGTIIPFEDGKFDVVPGQSGIGALAMIPPMRLAELRQELCRVAPNYDRVVMDIGAGIGRTVQDLVLGSGTCIVLTTEDPTALTDAYAFIKTIVRAGYASGIRIVVNMASDSRQGDYTYRALLRACESFLHVSPPLLGVVRRDSHVADAIRSQCSLFTRHPNCAAAMDISAIAARIETS